MRWYMYTTLISVLIYNYRIRQINKIDILTSEYILFILTMLANILNEHHSIANYTDDIINAKMNPSSSQSSKSNK